MGSSTLLCLLGLLAAGPQASQPKPQPNPAPPAALEGTVKDPQGQPVEKALVIARCTRRWDEPPLSTRTDAAGRFRLEQPGRGPCDVRIEAKGLASARLDGVRLGTLLVVALEKGGVIEGSVRDGATGQSVPGARVEAAVDGGGLTWEPGTGAIETVADAKGLFRLEGVGRGLHTVSARSRGYGQARKDGVNAGSRVDLYLPSGASLAGVVFGPNQKAVAGAVVRVENEARPWSDAAAVATDASGRFELLGLDPGSYRVVARQTGLALGFVSGVIVEADVETPVEVTLPRAATVTGRLLGPTERPVPGRVLVQELNGLPVSRSVAEMLRAEAGADGRFRLEGLPPGSHALLVNAPRHAPKRVDFDVVKHGVVDLADVSLEVGLTIRGRVRDRAGLPVAGARVRGLGGGPGMARPLECESEADGAFVLAGLQEGTYELRIEAPGYAPVTKHADAGAEKVDVVLSPGGSITGLVVDEAGRAVEAYNVRANAASERPFEFETEKLVTAADGRFVLEDLAEGTYAVEVTAPERASSVVSGVKVTAGSSADVGRIRLLPGGILRGTVTDTQGAPVSGATVTVFGASSLFESGLEQKATSDLSGSFEVRGVPAGKIQAIARHPQFAEAILAGIDVDPAQGPAEARFVLMQGGRIEGWVRRSDSSPLSDSVVRVLRPRQPGTDIPASGVSGPVRQDGFFVLEHLQPGQGVVHLMRGLGGRYSNVQSRDVVIRDGETVNVEFTPRDILVSGHVTRLGVPAPDLRVMLSGSEGYSVYSGPSSPAVPASGPQRLTAVTSEDGSYALLVGGPGSFYARVMSLDGKTAYLSKSVQVPDADTFSLDLNLAGASVTGVVVDRETSQPIARAWVSAFPRKGERTATGAESGADGRFELSLEEGDYRVSAQADGYAEDTADVTVSGGGASEIHLALLRGLSVKGRVLDAAGRGVSDLEVLGMAGADAERSLKWALTLADGSFGLTGLGERPYNVVTGSAVAGFALRLGVSPGEKDLVLRLRPGGRVRLLARGPDGQPVAGARTRLVKLSGAPIFGPRPTRGTTDSQGLVEISVPAGDLEIEVANEKLRGTVRVGVPEGGTIAREVTLTERSPS